MIKYIMQSTQCKNYKKLTSQIIEIVVRRPDPQLHLSLCPLAIQNLKLDTIYVSTHPLPHIGPTPNNVAPLSQCTSLQSFFFNGRFILM